MSTYGTIAALAGRPRQARLVGYAMHKLPEGSEVPWHRVINAQGLISLRSAGDGATRQARLLAAEGVRSIGNRIDLHTYGWPRRDFRPRR